MRKILLQVLVEGDESSVKCEANNATGIDLITAFGYICEAVMKAKISPSMLKMVVDFTESHLHD